MWLTCPPHETVVLGYAEAELRFGREPAPASSRLLEGGTYRRAVTSLEERLVKFGNMDNMQPKSRRRKGASRDSFVEPEDPDDMFKLKLVFPERNDFFVYRGTLSDFISSDLYAQRRAEKEHWARQPDNQEPLRAARRANLAHGSRTWPLKESPPPAAASKKAVPRVVSQPKEKQEARQLVVASAKSSKAEKPLSSSSSQRATFAFGQSRARRRANTKPRRATAGHS